ncbi:DNA-binding protein [Actinacidiphila glaucinigra]|uniref:DNA-binding protein n=1 Tax=Actinacidiphila glaucinigra TaxID=235986 RepID=UPI0035DDD3B5
MTTPALTIAQILDQPALVPLWPTVGQALGLAESTTYQLAAQDRLPIEVIRLGRRRMARIVDLQRFLGLLPEGTGVATGYQPAAPAAGNDEAAGYQPAAPVEHVTAPTTK